MAAIPNRVATAVQTINTSDVCARLKAEVLDKLCDAYRSYRAERTTLQRDLVLLKEIEILQNAVRRTAERTGPKFEEPDAVAGAEREIEGDKQSPSEGTDVQSSGYETLYAREVAANDEAAWKKASERAFCLMAQIIEDREEEAVLGAQRE